MKISSVLVVHERAEQFLFHLSFFKFINHLSRYTNYRRMVGKLSPAIPMSIGYFHIIRTNRLRVICFGKEGVTRKSCGLNKN